MTRFQPWAIPTAILLAGVLMATSILFTNRWDIAAVGYGYAGTQDEPTGRDSETVYRLDRWTGQIDTCMDDVERAKATGELGMLCPVKVPVR